MADANLSPACASGKPVAFITYDDPVTLPQDHPDACIQHLIAEARRLDNVWCIAADERGDAATAAQKQHPLIPQIIRDWHNTPLVERQQLEMHYAPVLEYCHSPEAYNQVVDIMCDVAAAYTARCAAADRAHRLDALCEEEKRARIAMEQGMQRLVRSRAKTVAGALLKLHYTVSEHAACPTWSGESLRASAIEDLKRLAALDGG